VLKCKKFKIQNLKIVTEKLETFNKTKQPTTNHHHQTTPATSWLTAEMSRHFMIQIPNAFSSHIFEFFFLPKKVGWLVVGWLTR
jgi:hypothetical protein